MRWFGLSSAMLQRGKADCGNLPLIDTGTGFTFNTLAALPAISSPSKVIRPGRSKLGIRAQTNRCCVLHEWRRVGLSRHSRADQTSLGLTHLNNSLSFLLGATFIWRCKPTPHTRPGMSGGMMPAQQFVDTCKTAWRETLGFAFEPKRPRLITLEWLLGRVEREDRLSK